MRKVPKNEKKTAKFVISAISAIKHGILRFISISAKNRGITESQKTGVLIHDHSNSIQTAHTLACIH